MLKSLLNWADITATSQFEQKGVSMWSIEFGGHVHDNGSNLRFPLQVRQLSLLHVAQFPKQTAQLIDT